ncbi:hypothetical protein G6514_003307 [Epicoccum nigrum]|nr:hypothetical protein G6514_003307 [Epicoccum nigrum]
MLLMVVVGGIELDLFEESSEGGVGTALDMGDGGLGARLVVPELEGEEKTRETPVIVLDTLLEVIFNEKDEVFTEEGLLLASVGNGSGLVALMILEFDEVDDWERLKVLDVGFARAGEEELKGVPLALVDVLDVTKEVARGGPTVTVTLMMLEEGEEERTTFRTVVVLEFRMVVTDVLREVILGEVWPIELVEEVDVMLIGSEVGVDKVLNVELELLIGPVRLGVDEAWLRVVTCEVGIEELVRIFEGSPLESSGIEVAADETQVEDDRIGLLVDVTEIVFKDREDMKATLVEDKADVEITADGVTPSADVGRLVDESGVEKDNVVLNDDDSDRDPDATELPGRREAEIVMAVVLVIWVVLVTVGLIPLPGTGFGSDTVNRPLEDVATTLAVDDWALIEPDEGREVSATELVPLIVIAVEVQQ